jgi:hypothetical protein
MDIRGLPENAHYMVMTSSRMMDGDYELVGNRAIFQDLLGTYPAHQRG